MCGLVGVAGDLSSIHSKMFSYLLKLDTIRGPHSTGVAVVDDNNNYKVFKEEGTPWEFMDKVKEFEDGHYKSPCKVLIGHNRWATVGRINKENAHPFEFDNIVGAHNGTLNEKICAYSIPRFNDFEVDSEAMLQNINDNGIESAYNNLAGAWAITWYDKSHNRVYFVRNNQRPLHYCYSATGKAVFWASESYMLEQAFLKFNLSVPTIYSTPTDELMFIEMSDEDRDGKDFKVELGDVELKDYFDTRVFSHNSNNGNNYASTGGSVLLGKFVSFYLTGDRFKDCLIGEELITGHIVEISLDSLSKKTLKVLLDKSKKSMDFNNFFIGKVSSIQRDLSSPSSRCIKVDVYDTSEPLDWYDFDNSFDSDDWGYFAAQKNCLNLVGYVMNQPKQLFLLNKERDSILKKRERDEDEYNIDISGHIVSYKDAKRVLQEPCLNCNGHDDIDNFSNIAVIGDNSYICSKCTENPMILNLAYSM